MKMIVFCGIYVIIEVVGGMKMLIEEWYVVIIECLY